MPCGFRWRFNHMGAASTPVSCVYASLSLPWPVTLGCVPDARSGRSLLVHKRCRYRVLVSWDPLLVSSSLYSPAIGKPLDLPRSMLWIRFSSSHFWSLLHRRHLSGVQPVSAVDCCLSRLWAGVCGHLWQWRIPARVLMVACLPLLWVWRSAPSRIPLMLCASTGFPVNPGLS